ncbi:MAG: hypothetical protein B7Z75_11500 [Acidocella sp. 20-57-95]|nr:MAG: hypothetical protein B7Z75_11500 [Acidocella sp. 20-57-95]
MFLKLGLTSFGGPVAHLGYFRRAFVEKHKWISEADFASLIGLCQFLPGPASSQTGFGIGLLRAGWLGGLAAWLGFTLPSAAIMFVAATQLHAIGGSLVGQKILHGLQLVAIAVVAEAVVTMTNNLCRDFSTRTLAVIGLLIVTLLPSSLGQISALIIGGIIGRYLLDRPKDPPAALTSPGLGLSHKVGILCGVAFLALLAVSFTLPLLGTGTLFSAFYRTGALVFGGGHVVLPLLSRAVVQSGWVPEDIFLAGYGIAQAMPGPLFTFAAFLGAVANGASGNFGGATIAVFAIFLPGLLLVAAVLPFWHGLKNRPNVAMTIVGLNAIVVGMLGYALINLVIVGTARSILDCVIVTSAYLALTKIKIPPIGVVCLVVITAVVF